MKIVPFYHYKQQMVQIGKSHWSIPRLIELSRDLPVFDAPIDCLCVSAQYDNLSMREMATHAKAIQEADLDYPIILDEDGEILDGRHRIMKAMILGLKSVKAVRFDENPSPCRVD